MSNSNCDNERSQKECERFFDDNDNDDYHDDDNNNNYDEGS